MTLLMYLIVATFALVKFDKLRNFEDNKFDTKQSNFSLDSNSVYKGTELGLDMIFAASFEDAAGRPMSFENYTSVDLTDFNVSSLFEVNAQIITIHPKDNNS